VSGARQLYAVSSAPEGVTKSLNDHLFALLKSSIKNSVCRLLKKNSEARRAKNRRAEAYLTSTLERGD
jgi:hypothetical protein